MSGHVTGYVVGNSDSQEAGNKDQSQSLKDLCLLPGGNLDFSFSKQTSFVLINGEKKPPHICILDD